MFPTILSLLPGIPCISHCIPHLRHHPLLHIPMSSASTNLCVQDHIPCPSSPILCVPVFVSHRILTFPILCDLRVHVSLQSHIPCFGSHMSPV